MIEQVRENISAHHLILPADRILVAVSGGLDSMVLLHLLHALKFRVEVAHFNHKLRGAESAADQAFVREQAAKLGLPFHSDEADVAAAAASGGISIEMAARQLRHRFLARTAQCLGEASIPSVALAHHADDQVETFWLRLLRGNAGEGLAGMRWSNLSPVDPTVRLIRPLLNLSKPELSAFAKENAIPFREDSSNLDPSFQRNRLRREILPLLEQYQPQLRQITHRLARVLSDEKDFIRVSAAVLSYDDAHPAVQREMLRAALLEQSIQPTFELIEALRTSTHPINVADNLFVRRGSGATIICFPRKAVPEFESGQLWLDLTGPGRATFGHLDFAWEFVPERSRAQPGVEYFDADQLGRSLLLRHWQPGDHFQPIGLPAPAKLQDLFTNAKVPSTERRHRILASRSDAQIVWVEGLRLGEVAKVRPETSKILEWKHRLRGLAFPKARE